MTCYLDEDITPEIQLELEKQALKRRKKHKLSAQSPFSGDKYEDVNTDELKIDSGITISLYTQQPAKPDFFDLSEFDKKKNATISEPQPSPTKPKVRVS